jgi:hypothetical protein
VTAEIVNNAASENTSKFIFVCIKNNF